MLFTPAAALPRRPKFVSFDDPVASRPVSAGRRLDEVTNPSTQLTSSVKAFSRTAADQLGQAKT